MGEHQGHLKKDFHFTFYNQAGSVEHYYHFLLGFFVPMVLSCDEILKTENVSRIFVRSCSILDRHIMDVGFPQVIIFDKLLHRTIRSDSDLIKTDGIPVVFREFVGYDDPCKYNAVFFNKAHNILKVQLADEIKGCRVDVNKQFNQHGQKVLLLERGVPDKHYICTNRTSGRERRSIKNFQTVYHELKKHYPNTLALRLEGKSLAFQMALFNTVDVVIAQHGAALTNAIWCNDKCKIIEIVPPEIRQAAFKKNNLGHLAFDYLAKALSLRYYRLPQDNRHSDVDIKNLLSLMSGIYSKSRFFNFRSVIKMM